MPPRANPADFEAELELTFERLNCQRLDLLAIHGINLPEHLEQTLRPSGCMDVVRRWQADGRIGHVGFSTHGPTDLITASCNSGAFDYVNLHWYYIRQDNSPALMQPDQDMGVFIISPTDKGDICTPHPSGCLSCVIRCIRSSSTTCSVCGTRGFTPSAWVHRAREILIFILKPSRASTKLLTSSLRWSRGFAGSQECLRG